MKIFLFLIFILSAPSALAQGDTSYSDPAQVLEDLLRETDEEADNSAASDAVEEFFENPVDLNTAEINELLAVPYLDLNTANKILEYRKKFGPFFSSYEIYSIKDISPENAAKIIPFLKTEYENDQNENYTDSYGGNEKNFSFKMRSRAAKDLQTRKAFKENRFSGSGYKYYSRFLGKALEKYQFGILAEKDPGEKRLDEFTSFFLSAGDLGILKNAVAGDYTLEAGQGIALWSPYGFSKGSEAVFPLKKNFKTIKPYKSTDENRFFRGAAAEIGWDNFSITAFLSGNKLDANIDSASSSISSVPVTGFHRTENELSQRKTAYETLMGTKADCMFKIKSGENEINLNLGALYYYSEFSNPFRPSDLFDISGNVFGCSSFYYDLFYRSINFFGEVTYNGISAASINGIMISVTKEFSYTTSIRSYPRNFYSLHGSSLAEGSAKNEIGFYNGLRWKTIFGTLNFYFDQFKFPYARYRVPLPSAGTEFLFSLQSKPFSKLEARIRIKQEDKEISGEDNFSKLIMDQIKRSMRLELIYSISKNIRLRGIYEINNFRVKDLNLNEQGFLVSQDIKVSLLDQFNISCRISFFKTESFYSAVYLYENDLQGISSSPALYGEGIKWYLVLKYKLTNAIAWSCKYSELYKPGEKTLYSGDEEITGDTDNKLSMQLDLNF